jgi:hypothetical protein
MIGVLPWLVCWTRCVGTIDFCLGLGCSNQPHKNIIFRTVHFFTLLVPIAQQPEQAGVLGHLSLCLWDLLEVLI